MPAGFVRTNRQSLKAKYIDCEIQISRHCYKPAWSNLQRTPGKCISHKLYKLKCVCLCFKQCLKRPLEVFPGQCPQVTCPSRNTKWTWTKYKCLCQLNTNLKLWSSVMISRIVSHWWETTTNNSTTCATCGPCYDNFFAGCSSQHFPCSCSMKWQGQWEIKQ